MNRVLRTQGCFRQKKSNLEHQSRTLGLFITTIAYVNPCSLTSFINETYPNSKCLHRFNANCALVLHALHSNLSTTFFVVLAFLWKTGLVWPPVYV
jgi:hypothetical protein